ncbi:MAG TPA: type III effector, partial [Methylococcaceae bacterium]|nr:type III effector [Methylococcaceae bacterium]
MTLTEFLDKLKSNEPVGFDETMAVIAEHYEYQPAEFSNGLEN